MFGKDPESSVLFRETSKQIASNDTPIFLDRSYDLLLRKKHLKVKYVNLHCNNLTIYYNGAKKCECQYISHRRPRNA